MNKQKKDHIDGPEKLIKEVFNPDKQVSRKVTEEAIRALFGNINQVNVDNGRSDGIITKIEH